MENFFERLRDHLHFNKFTLNNVLCVEYSCPIPDVEIDIWTQSDYIIHVLSGKKSWRTLQGTFEVHEGETVYVKKGAAFIRQFFEDDFCMLAFFLSDDLIREALKEALPDLENRERNADLDFHLLYLKDNGLLSTYFQGMLHHFQGKDKPLDSFLELKFKELIISLMMSKTNTQLTSYFIEISKNSLPLLPYIMEQNYTYNLTIEEFAKLCHRSLSSFKRDFQDHFGISPGKWLLAKRLDRAAMLLHNDALNISQVAYECGFEDNSHFSRTFKSRFGDTPINYRNGLISG